MEKSSSNELINCKSPTLKIAFPTTFMGFCCSHLLCFINLLIAAGTHQRHDFQWNTTDELIRRPVEYNVQSVNFELVMSECRQIQINLCKSDEGSFGFSLLGKFAGIPHVIYDVIEDSPAAECEVSCLKKLARGDFIFQLSRVSERVCCFFGVSTLLMLGSIPDNTTHVHRAHAHPHPSSDRPMLCNNLVKTSHKTFLDCIVVFVFSVVQLSLWSKSQPRKKEKF